MKADITWMATTKKAHIQHHQFTVINLCAQGATQEIPSLISSITYEFLKWKLRVKKHYKNLICKIPFFNGLNYCVSQINIRSAAQLCFISTFVVFFPDTRIKNRIMCSLRVRFYINFPSQWTLKGLILSFIWETSFCRRILSWW